MSSHLTFAVEMAEALERLAVPYVLGGSVAASLYGEPRTTLDIDIAIRLDAASLDRLLVELGGEFYIPTAAARRAVETATWFNALRNDNGLKFDFFVLGGSLLDRRQFERRQEIPIFRDPPRSLWGSSAEDVVLRKLDWYRLGGGVSDQQWRDIVGVLRAQHDYLDFDYLLITAADCDLGPLLTRACEAAAI
jgi:hypothetical protein